MTIQYDISGNVYGEAAEFTSANIPTFNRIIYTEIDTGKIKIGVTGTAWNDLGYKSGGGGSMEYTQLINSNVTLTNAFQSIVSHTPTKVSSVNGVIDIDNLTAGDIIFVEVTYNGKTHSLLQYNDEQNMPMLIVKDMLVYPGDTYNVNIKQTAGSAKSVSFKFYAGA